MAPELGIHGEGCSRGSGLRTLLGAHSTAWASFWRELSCLLQQSQLPSRPSRVQTLSPSSQGAFIPKWRGMRRKNKCMHSFFFFFGHAVQHAGFKFPDQGLNWCPLQWKCGDLTTGLPRKSQCPPSYCPRGFLYGTEKHYKLTEERLGNTLPRKSASGPDECLFNNCLVMIINSLRISH